MTPYLRPVLLLLVWVVTVALLPLRDSRICRISAGLCYCAGGVFALALTNFTGVQRAGGLLQAAAAVAFVLYAIWAAGAATGAGRFQVRHTHLASGVACGVAAFCLGVFTIAVARGEIPAALGLAAAGCITAIVLGGVLPAHLPAIGGTVRGGTAVVASAILLITSFSVELDLFAPLTMKVMKLAHDFVHQFFEAMLIPDHFFFRDNVWGYIGFFFGDAVGFWGALALWLLPPILVIMSLWREPLPSVAHLRQGAARRKIVADHLLRRRRTLFMPVVALLVAGLAVAKSLNPSVEYWDPVPVAVSPDSGGAVFISDAGSDYNLADGKLRKFILRQDRQAVRFFVMKRSDGYAVALDACAICQPEGYGQGEGAVYCYYCKTLIPLETVGAVGGCNPVPVTFLPAPGGVKILARDLVNKWLTTIQQTSRTIPSGR